MREEHKLPDLTTTLDDRQVRLLLEGADQTSAVIEALLVFEAMDSCYAPTLRALLLRLRAINSATLRVLDPNDDNVNEMEVIVFGAVQSRRVQGVEA